MAENHTFSERHGYVSPDAEITIRHDAPFGLRAAVVEAAYQAGLRPEPLRRIVCRVLSERPDENNWSEFPNIDGEVRQLIDSTEWFHVYDVIEAIHAGLRQTHGSTGFWDRSHPPDRFTEAINRYFRQKGIGWQLVDGQIQIRGPESFEEAVRESRSILASTGRTVAAQEIHQALADLSRRPTPDITGAIQHAIAALECVARDVSGDQNATLGDLVKRNPGLIPAPLDKGVEKIWGYASDQARHVREGQMPDIREAELVVGLAGVVTTYLAKRHVQT